MGNYEDQDVKFQTIYVEGLSSGSKDDAWEDWRDYAELVFNTTKGYRVWRVAPEYSCDKCFVGGEVIHRVHGTLCVFNCEGAIAGLEEATIDNPKAGMDRVDMGTIGEWKVGN